MVCPNETDQFAVGNNKAKLTYPVALLTDEERYNINTSSLVASGNDWWSISPSFFYDYSARLRNVGSSGSSSDG